MEASGCNIFFILTGKLEFIVLNRMHALFENNALKTAKNKK